jgi:hypothetical protein
MLNWFIFLFFLFHRCRSLVYFGLKYRLSLVFIKFWIHQGCVCDFRVKAPCRWRRTTTIVRSWIIKALFRNITSTIVDIYFCVGLRILIYWHLKIHSQFLVIIQNIFRSWALIPSFNSCMNLDLLNSSALLLMII